MAAGTPPAQDPASATQPGQAHAPGNLRVVGVLLGTWLAVTFGVGFFARDLQFHVAGWPFSFWMGAQGGVIVYVVITFAYARWMARLERR
ncbi:MAG: DUF4212 domain-containing protein [Ramlibacter sp.]